MRQKHLIAKIIFKRLAGSFVLVTGIVSQDFVNASRRDTEMLHDRGSGSSEVMPVPI